MEAQQALAGIANSGGMIVSMTLAQKLDRAVGDAEVRLEKAKRAREILNRYPDIEELIDVLRYF